MARQFPVEVIEVGDKLAVMSPAIRDEFIEYVRNVHALEVTINRWTPDPNNMVGDVLVAQPKREFFVRLQSYEPKNKVAIVKIIREVNHFGLLEAKKLADCVQDGDPQIVQSGLSMREAELLQEKLSNAGALAFVEEHKNVINVIDPSIYKVQLDVVPRDNRISMIRAIRDIKNWGLVEAKNLVDLVEAGTPQIVQDDLSFYEAEYLEEKLILAGATGVTVIQYDVIEKARTKSDSAIYKVSLTAITPHHKIAAIKMIRNFKKQGLREAKEFVERVENGIPQMIGDRYTLQEATSIKNELLACGAAVSLTVVT